MKEVLGGTVFGYNLIRYMNDLDTDSLSHTVFKEHIQLYINNVNPEKWIVMQQQLFFLSSCM